MCVVGRTMLYKRYDRQDPTYHQKPGNHWNVENSVNNFVNKRKMLKSQPKMLKTMTKLLKTYKKMLKSTRNC